MAQGGTNAQVGTITGSGTIAERRDADAQAQRATAVAAAEATQRAADEKRAADAKAQEETREAAARAERERRNAATRAANAAVVAREATLPYRVLTVSFHNGVLVRPGTILQLRADEVADHHEPLE